MSFTSQHGRVPQRLPQDDPADHPGVGAQHEHPAPRNLRRNRGGHFIGGGGRFDVEAAEREAGAAAAVGGHAAAGAHGAGGAARAAGRHDDAAAEGQEAAAASGGSFIFANQIRCLAIIVTLTVVNTGLFIRSGESYF